MLERKAVPRPDPGSQHAAPQPARPPQRAPLPLAAPVADALGSRFDFDFGKVRVHAEASDVLPAGARGLTRGSEIRFAPTVYPPRSDRDWQTVAHELTHVVQQGTAAGETAPRERLEAHAWSAASRALHGRTVQAAEVGRAQPGIPQYDIGDRGATGRHDPNALIPVADFIGYVAAVERAYPQDSPTDIVTRIRQQYYSGIAFDQLILRAHTHDIYPSWSPYGGSETTVRRRLDRSLVGNDAYTHLNAQADENAVGDNPSPYIVMPGGEQVDAGHVLLGLDSLLHPEVGTPYTDYGVPGIDPASWVADLGIASVWMTYHEEEHKPHGDAPVKLSAPDLDAYYHMSAPDADLLGDVDAFALNRQWARTPGQTLSAVLRAYYLGGSGARAPVANRWTTFCAANGLTFTQTGASIAWSAAFRALLIARIDRFNDLYAAGSYGSAWSVTVGTPSHRTWPHTPAMLDKFLAWIKPRVEAELAAQVQAPVPAGR